MKKDFDRTVYQLVATSAFGLEALVRRELEALGYSARIVEPGRIAFEGTSRDILRTNLWLRTADRILIKIAEFAAGDFDALFESTRAIDWTPFIHQQGQFPVNGRCIRSQLTSVPACQRSIKRAIAESLIRDYSCTALPENGSAYRVDFTILKDIATLTLDTSGIGLHRRGYHERGSAPQIKETLAAALVMLSYWKNGRPMIDPYCRGGTIAIEAAMIGMNIPPGFNRSFACEEWSEDHENVAKELRSESNNQRLTSLETRIIANDTDPRILHQARSSADKFGVHQSIHFECKELHEIRNQKRFGCLITLPILGEKFQYTRDRDDYYRQLPDLFRRLPTWSHYVFTDFRQLEALLGRPADRRRKLYSGRDSMTYFQFHGPKPVTNPLNNHPSPSNLSSDDSLVDQPPVAISKNTPQRATPLSEKLEVAPSQIDQESKSPQSTNVNAAPSSLKRTEFSFAEKPDRSSPSEPKPNPAANHQEPRYEHASGPAAFGELSAKSREQATLFASRIRKRAKHLRRWPSKRGITCYRIYERDIPEIPLVVDLYEDCIHITEYERPHERDIAEHANWLELMGTTAANCLEIRAENVYLKRRERQKGKNQHDKVAETFTRKEVQEGGLKFLVNLADYVDTGLFLDHRVTRGMVRDQAKGKSFLNLFCYTGSFTVYAADGGASRSVSVDLSRNYLEWAKANLELNRLHGNQHQFIAKDVLQFIQDHPKRPSYDLVVIDPPTFSNSKRTENDWTVQGQAEELLRHVLPLVTPGGVIYFSTNFRRFKFAPENLGLAEAHEISRQTVPEDFRNRRIHRCWRLVR